jgi:hypothetical protein
VLDQLASVQETTLLSVVKARINNLVDAATEVLQGRAEQ